MRSEETTTATPSAPPAPAGRFSSNVRWTLLGTAANSLCTWLLIVILARTSGAAAVGDYALALALTAPIMAFAGLQIRTLVASDPTRQYAFREYLRVSYLGVGLGILACFAFSLVVGDGHGDWVVLGAVVAMRAADAMAEVYFGLWQQHERMSVIGIGRVIQAVVSIALVVVAGAMGAGSVGAALAGAAGSIVLMGYLQQVTRRDAAIAADAAPGPTPWPRLRALVLQGVPLGLIVLLGALQYNVPRYFIELHAGKAALGLFAAAGQLTTSGNILVGALGAAALPRLAATGRTGYAAFRALTLKLCLTGAGLGVAGVAVSALIGRQVLSLLYRPEFGEAAPVLVVLSIGAGFGFVASFLGYALTATRVIAIQPILLIATLGVMVGFCALLVPGSGALGAAWALVWGSVVQMLGSVLVLRRARPIGGEAP